MKGVEPPRRRRQILSLVRLPIPPHPHTLFIKLVEDGGFEPPKAMLTDLQSAPFGRSGNPPDGAGDRNRTYNLLITSQLLFR